MDSKVLGQILKILDLINIPKKYIFVITIVTGTLLSINNDILSRLGLKSFVNDYKKWIGLCLVISIALLLVELITMLIGKINKSINLKHKQKQLHELTNVEKEILRCYIKKQTKSQSLDQLDGNVARLEKMNIIYKSIPRYINKKWIDYNIQPWAWEYLNKHKELLEINSNISTDNSVNL